MNNTQDLYKVDLMRTLWENTYRGTVFNYEGKYTATIRLILGIPMDRDSVPDNAPQVQPYVTVLVEDTVLHPSEVLDFESVLSKIVIQRTSSEYFRPDRCIFFYPSPADAVPEKTPSSPAR